MEEMHGVHLARTVPNGEERSACGGGTRLAGTLASRMENYAEIFGGFSASCSIPVLVLPEAMDGYEEELVGSQSSGLNYLEIFRVLDAGTFSLSYEALLSMEKGSNEKDEKDDRIGLDETDVGQVETGSPELSAEVPVRGCITFSNFNQMSSSFHSNSDAGTTSQQSTVDEVRDTICVSRPQANCRLDFEAETVHPTRLVEDDSTSNVASDDHILSGYMTQEKEAGKQREILHRCFVGASSDDSENDLNDVQKSPSKGAAYDLKQLSRSSSYHSTSSGDIPLSDYAFLTISDINLHTQPLEVPPPLRAPPKLDKQGMSKSVALEAANFSFNRNFQAHHAGGPRTRHALKGTVKNTAPFYSNVEVDASKAAAASAAAMIEAMEQAQASLKSAKELMERKRDSPQSDRSLGCHDFGFWNEQNIIFSGDSKHKTKKTPKVVPSQVEKVTSVLSEDAEEAIRGKESGSCKPSGENERSQKWKKDKQFYELVSSEKLIRNRVINGEKCNNNEDVELDHRLDASQYFSQKESCGLQRQRLFLGGDDNEDENKVETLNTFKINENKFFSGGEFQMQKGNAKTLKFGTLINKEKVMNIFETSSMSCLQKNEEDKQKIGQALPVLSEDREKVVDTISLIQHDRNENELKQYQDSTVYAEDKNNTDSDTEPNTYGMNVSGMNVSGLMGFYVDGKLEDFDGGEVLEETLEQVKETHVHTSNKEEISETFVVFEYDAFKSDECMTHSRIVDNCNVSSEFGISKECKETKLSSLQNGNEVEVDAEYRPSCSCEKEKNMEATRKECNCGMLKQIKKEIYFCYNDVKDSEVEGIHNKSERENRSFSGIDQTIEPVKKQRAKWNLPNRSELNVAKLFVQPVCLEKAEEVLEFQQNEEKNACELPQKFEDYDGRLTAGGEQRKDEKNVLGKVQAALELEKKIMGLSATQQVFQRIRVQDSKSLQRANSLDDKGNILSPSVDASGSSWKQMEKSKSYQWRDAINTSNEILNRERNKEAEQKRKLEEKERVREREKDMISVQKVTRVDCEGVFIEVRDKSENIVLESVATEARHRPILPYRDITEKSSAEQFERSENVVNEVKLLEERAAVERGTVEARERAIERALTEQVSIGDRRQMVTSGNDSKDKSCKAEGNVRPGDKECNNNPKPTSDVHDAPIEVKSQSEGCEGESPLRFRARQERCKRVTERAAKALAEKNMRDLLAQREQAERNRLAESLDAEVRRWSSGKEGNLRALLSTLQYILGHDSGWHPIPLTEVITAAAVRKAYRKATLYVHPDKLQQRGATIQHKYICEKVFDLLKDAWNKFNSEG